MIRKHENSDSWKAGMYALAVHVALLVGMLVSFNWKAAHPVMNVTEVELWDKLPAPKNVVTPEPDSKPVPKVEEKPKVEDTPKPKVEEKPMPAEPKVDIELEKKKKEEIVKKEQELAQKLIQKKKLEALQAETREDALKDKVAADKAQKDALKKLQQEALSDEKGNDDKQASSAANASLIGEYTEKIKAKIRGNVNKTLCGDGNPELRFEIGLLPTGELSGTPKLTKSSGNDACDDAVERAIAASQPLPLPSDPAIYSKFRSLNLKFRPND